MTRCEVPKCSETGTHRFPKDETVKKKWLKAIQRPKLEVTKATRLCAKNLLVQIIAKVDQYNAKNVKQVKSGMSLAERMRWKKNASQYYTKLKSVIKIPRVYGPIADEMMKDIKLDGKCALVTGANSGLGLEMARQLGARGGRVLLACRNTYAAAAAARGIADLGPAPAVLEANLASLNSVKDCSEQIIRSGEKLDIVILNAAVFGLPWTLTEDGLETTFQVNFLSQYYLLTRLEEALAPNARVVFVSSESHRNVHWSIHDQLVPHEGLLSLPKKQYTAIKAYNTSKLCGILAMHSLGYRWLKSGRSVFAAHPGSFVKTGLSRNWWMYELMYTAMKPFSKTVAQAAATPLYCATSPELRGHSTQYFKDCRMCHESALAQDTLLSFRVIDLVTDILQSRLRQLEVVKETVDDKDLSTDTLVSA